MVIMATKQRIQKLRKFFEPGSSSSLDITNRDATVSPSSNRSKKKMTKANDVLWERSPNGSHPKTSPDARSPPTSRFVPLSDLKNRIKFSKNQVRLARKGGIRQKARGGSSNTRGNLAASGIPDWYDDSWIPPAGGSHNPPSQLPRSKSTGQLYGAAEEDDDLRESTPVLVKKSLSQNPLCTESEYAVPCGIPVLKEPETHQKKSTVEYENTRRFANRGLGRRDHSADNGVPQGSITQGSAGVTYRYKYQIQRRQDSFDRRASRSLPDLTFQEDSIKIVGAKGLFQNLNHAERSPQKPAVPPKSPRLTASHVGNGIPLSPDPSAPSIPHTLPSPSFTANTRTRGDPSSNVGHLRTRFEKKERGPPETLETSDTTELPGYEEPTISPGPVSGGSFFEQNFYHTPDTTTSTQPEEAEHNLYENPDNPDTIQDPLNSSGNPEKLKKIFGVQDLKGDILDKKNQLPRKAVKQSRTSKKKSTLERNEINFYAVSQLQTSNTNVQLRGGRRNMDGSTYPAHNSPGGRSPIKETSSSSADSGTSHTYSLQSLSPRSSERKPSSDDPNLRDSDFIDGEIDFEERVPRGSDSDFESEEEGSKVKAPKPPTFNNNSHKVAYELLTSERTYVDRLYLLSAIFQTKISADNYKHKWFPGEVIKDIFSNISSIYNFHFVHFLPELEMRLLQWDRRPCIGDILKTLSHFLKMYAEYVSNFDKAMSQLNTWRAKTPKFANALSNITQNEKRCNGLALEHHMLEPVQRIPRYKLLLEEYLKKLPENSQDRDDAMKALEVISQAAEHSNNRMKVMEEIGNLFKLNARIDGMDIIDPSRRLLKEGRLMKVTPKNDHQERYIFFFNDLLLSCVTKRTKLTSNKAYKLKEKLEVDGMQVLDSDGVRFQVEAAGNLLEFMAASEEDKEEWLKVLWSAVREVIRKKDTFRSNFADAFDVSYEDTLGKEPPVHIKDDEVTMCMRCGTDFERLLKRRHHCRACGYVICGRCSCNQIELPYDSNKLNRVCSRCFQKLAKQPVMDDLTRRSFVPDLEVTEHYATALDVLQKGTWVRYWVAVTQQDLFALKAPRDVRAVLTLPVKLYEVGDVSETDGITDRDHVFKLVHGPTQYHFAAQSNELKVKWMRVLADGVEAHVKGKSEFTTL